MPDRRLDLVDRRILFWMDLEEEIQIRAPNKDPKFVLIGPGNVAWKRLIREEDGLKVFAVDGEKVRNNLSVMFGHGGHGLVHEFIPLDEIWVDIRHYSCFRLPGCGCDNLKRKNQPVSEAFFESTVIHEKTEFWQMRNMEKRFNEADLIAREAEKLAGLLETPTTEINRPYPVLKFVKETARWM